MHLLLFYIIDMNVIFAVTEFMHPIYEKLADFLGQTGNVGKLPKVDKENPSGSSDDGMKRLIVEQYGKIRGDLLIKKLPITLLYLQISFMHNCKIQNFKISGKVRVTPVGNDDLTMLFQQMSKGGMSKSVTSVEDKKFNCPTGKTNKQEFECTGIPAKGEHEIWGKVM